GRSAGSLIRQEEDGVRELARIGERVDGLTRLCATEGLDARVDDQQRDVDAMLTELERGCLGDRTDAEGTRGPKPAAGCGATRRPPGGGRAGGPRPRLEREGPGRGREGDGGARGGGAPRTERMGRRRGEGPAAEGAVSTPAVGRGGVDDELDASVLGA